MYIYIYIYICYYIYIYIYKNDIKAREYVTSQGTLAREHVRHAGT